MAAATGGPTDPDPLIGFSFLVPCVGGALLVMTVAGYRGLKRPS